jgi:hypothetical protein
LGTWTKCVCVKRYRRQTVSGAKGIGGKTYRRQNISAAKLFGSKMYQWENVFVTKCIGGKRIGGKTYQLQASLEKPAAASQRL